jgi:hypothetical protein
MSRQGFTPFGVVAFLALSLTVLLKADQGDGPIFRCNATASEKECMFSIEHPDGSGGVSNFVLGPGETHGMNETVIGGRYCVAVVPKHSGSNLKWPECWGESGRRKVKAPPAVNE